MLEAGANPLLNNNEGKAAYEYCSDQEKMDLIGNYALRHVNTEIRNEPAILSSKLVDQMLAKGTKKISYQELLGEKKSDPSLFADKFKAPSSNNGWEK